MSALNCTLRSPPEESPSYITLPLYVEFELHGIVSRSDVVSDAVKSVLVL